MLKVDSVRVPTCLQQQTRVWDWVNIMNAGKQYGRHKWFSEQTKADLAFLLVSTVYISVLLVDGQYSLDPQPHVPTPAQQNQHMLLRLVGCSTMMLPDSWHMSFLVKYPSL